MAIEFKLPELGENIESCDVVSVLVSEGQTIAANQDVVEIEAGKGTFPIPCPHAGKVVKVHVQVGQSLAVGQSVLSLDGVSAAAPKAAPAAESSTAAAAPQPVAPAAAAAAQPTAPSAPLAAPPARVAEPVAVSAPATKGGQVATEPREPVGIGKAAPAGPATRRLARELGVDIGHIMGSGPGGRIMRDDVVASVREAATPSRTETEPSSVLTRRPAVGGVEGRDHWGVVRREPLSRIRKTIATNMAKSSATIPHVTNFDDADITELERIRKGSKADYVGSEIKLTMMAFVMKAVAQSLRLHPLLNASLDLEYNQTVYKDYVNLGVAVDTERGLVVPVIRDADRLTIPAIAQAMTQIAAKARANQFTMDDLRGGTFTISNLGAIGGNYSTPIINPPEVGVLLLGRSRNMPVVVDDEVVVRLMMPLSLSYDHRLVDGAVAARFLNEVKSYLQIPGRLLLAT